MGYQYRTLWDELLTPESSDTSLEEMEYIAPQAMISHGSTSNIDAKERLERQKAANEMLWVSQLEGTFSLLDEDRDGFVTKREIDDAIMDPAIRGDYAAVAVIFKQQIRKFQKVSNDEYGIENSGITRSDLKNMPEDLKQETKSDILIYGSRIRTTKRDLIKEDIVSVGIEQGKIGNCVFMAALASLADHRPDDIWKMFQKNHDGSFTVSFPGHKPLPVPMPTEGEIGFGAAGDSIWLTLLEKAYGMLHRNGKAIPAEKADRGHFNKDGIETLTGHSATSILAISMNREQIGNRLSDAFDHRRIVTAAIGLRPGRSDVDGLPTDHAYSVLDWNRAAEEITLRNPWGKTELNGVDEAARDGVDEAARDGVEDGRFVLNLDELIQYFDVVTFENAK